LLFLFGRSRFIIGLDVKKCIDPRKRAAILVMEEPGAYQIIHFFLEWQGKDKFVGK